MFIIINSWIVLSGLICDKKVPVKMNNKLYKTVIRRTLLYSSDCWTLHRSEQQRLHTTDMKMLRWIQSKTRKDRIINEKFRSDVMVKPITTYVTQKRLSWYGHVTRREDTNVAKKVTPMKVGWKIPRGRPILRWMDRVRSDRRQHKLDPELAQKREARRKAIMAIYPGQGYNRQRGAKSTK